MNVFVRKPDLSNLLGYQITDAHEISILLNDNQQTESLTDSLSQQYQSMDVKSWKEIMPEVGLLDDTMNVYLYIIMGIILLALLFGIVNTMLMVVLERTKELGMLMAIGMNKIRVFSMIVLETIMLSLTGGITGTILGYGLVQLYATNGMDLSVWQEGLESIGYDSIIYPYIGFNDLIQVTIMVIGTGILAAIYPSIKALKLNPAEALRIE
jgi:ABC-type lipoprotein release transport system permease subunit